MAWHAFGFEDFWVISMLTAEAVVASGIHHEICILIANTEATYQCFAIPSAAAASVQPSGTAGGATAARSWDAVSYNLVVAISAAYMLGVRRSP